MSTSLLPRGARTLAAAAALASCAPPPPPPPDLAAAEAEVRAASQGHVAAEAAKDTEAALAFWASDAIYQSPNEPTAQGTDALRAGYTRMFSEETGVAEIEGTITAVHVAASGDVAWEHGGFRWVVNMPGGPVTYTGKYLAVWEKRESAWKIAAMASSSDAPPPAPNASTTP